MILPAANLPLELYKAPQSRMVETQGSNLGVREVNHPLAVVVDMGSQLPKLSQKNAYSTLTTGVG